MHIDLNKHKHSWKGSSLATQSVQSWDPGQPSRAECCRSTGAGSAPCTQHLRWLQVNSQLELHLLQWTLATLPTWKLRTAANFKGIYIPEHTLLWNQRWRERKGTDLWRALWFECFGTLRKRWQILMKGGGVFSPLPQRLYTVTVRDIQKRENKRMF